MPILPNWIERTVFFTLNQGPTPMGNAINSLLGLSYLHLLDGRLYTFDEVVAWFVQTGFGRPRRINLLKAPGSSLIVGTKP